MLSKWILIEGRKELKIVGIFEDYNVAEELYWERYNELKETTIEEELMLVSVEKFKRFKPKFNAEKYPWIEPPLEPKPSEKQLAVIEVIESNLGIKFKGNTLEEATEFISKNIEESKIARQAMFDFLTDISGGYDW